VAAGRPFVAHLPGRVRDHPPGRTLCLRGHAARCAGATGEDMDRPGTAMHQPPRAGEGDRLRGLALRELITEAARKAGELARKEVELARAEVREDLRAEATMASGLVAAGACALLGVELLLTALVLGLMEAGVLPGWAAALLVAAVVLAIGVAAGLWGWTRRVRRPLDTTRRSLQDSARWAKELLA